MEVSRLKRARREERRESRTISVKARKIIAAVCAAVLGIAFLLFTADLVRVKKNAEPPMFCIPMVKYSNGSVDYYGLFYKVWEDYDPFDKETHYYMGFWFVPKYFNI